MAFLAFISCSDFDEQEFIVLIPNAGIDQVIFTEVPNAPRNFLLTVGYKF